MAHANYLNALACLLPPLLDNPVSELLRLITAFSKVTNDWINGADGCECLIQCYHTANAKFKEDIQETPPDFRPFESAEAQEAFDAAGFHSAIEDDPTDGWSHNIKGSMPLAMYLPEIQEYVQR